MFKPSSLSLEKYAQILIKFALGSGAGIKPDQIVMLGFDIQATPLALEIYKTILKAGGHPIVRPNEEQFSKIFYDYASKKQLEFFPKKYFKTMVDTIDHRVYIMANRNPLLLNKTDPKKIIQANKNTILLRKWMNQKEDQGKFTWTLALYPTQGLADQAGLTVDQYWQQIKKACFINEIDPIEKWKQVSNELDLIKNKLNKLKIKTVNIKAKDTNITIGFGQLRKWMGGSGRNIPSFELFTSPDWRLVNGKIFFDLPLYRYGNLIKDIYLEFKDGLVTKSKASKNEKLLKELIRQKNADRIGEFSLTDRRYSHITRFMAHTLYDENFGGQYGNTHLALGSSYHDAYAGDGARLDKKDWQKLGFNESAEHTDIIQKSDRVVTASLGNSVKKVIYQKGQFLI